MTERQVVQEVAYQQVLYLGGDGYGAAADAERVGQRGYHLIEIVADSRKRENIA